MSLPTSPDLLYGNHHTSIRQDPFNQHALEKRFKKVATNTRLPCDYPPVAVPNPRLDVSPPCCAPGKDMLGMGLNTGILDYQFGSSLDVPFCGVPIQPACGPFDPSASTPNCSVCPCRSSTCATLNQPGAPCCNYGFAREHNSAFGPSGGNRYGNVKWG